MRVSTHACKLNTLKNDSEHERLSLEKKIDQRKEYQRMYYDIRAQEVKQELDRMEQQRLRNQLRNESLL